MSWPFSPARPPHIVRAEGCYLYTDSGRAILDAAGGAIVANVGHGRERVARRVAEATRRASYVVPPWLTPEREALANALVRSWLPAHLTRIHVTSGGSEGVEAAIRIALQYHAAQSDPSRTRILGRDLSYHGTTFATLAAGGHDARKRGIAHALGATAGLWPKAPTPYPLRCPIGATDPAIGAFYLAATRKAIEAAGPETIAAFIAEPVCGASGGAIVPPEDYWSGIRALCDEYGVLLIADEVMTGFGRTGARFASEHWDARPDILVAGKGLAGGYAPLGGVFATEPIGAALDRAGYHVMFHTFAAHPAACAAAVEVLDILEEEHLVERCGRVGALLGARLGEAFSNHPHVAEARGLGLLRAIEIVRDRTTLEPWPERDAITSRVVAAGLERDVFFYGGGTGTVRDIVCMGPPFTITETDVDRLVGVLVEAVDSVTRP
jgi:adenosylmethionine-8-amino-7-oxononanoate aminotransferase